MEVEFYNYKPNKSKWKFNGKTVYDFNQVTGVLKMSINPSALEILLKKIGDIPEKGVNLELPVPLLTYPFYFEGVKEIKPIKKRKYIIIPNKEGNWITMNYD